MLGTVAAVLSLLQEFAHIITVNTQLHISAKSHLSPCHRIAAGAGGEERGDTHTHM